jgi:O-antigen ligase
MVASLKMIKDNLLFGVGANNFLVQLSEFQQKSGVFWLQPVHNIVFLVVTEFGFVGLFVIF